MWGAYFWSYVMKVKLLVSRAGVDFSQNAGEIIDVDEAEAGRMHAAGQCEFIVKTERATSKKNIQKAVKG
jgi:hypothetical protein